MMAWSVDDEKRFTLMLLSKGMYNLMSRVHYRALFSPETIFNVKGDCPFEVLMKEKPAGFFQARVEAFWLSTSLDLCSTFLKAGILTFQNLRHVVFDFSRDQETEESMDDAICCILSIPLESIWLLNRFLLKLGVVLGTASGKSGSSNGSSHFESLHSLYTVTHIYTTSWSTVIWEQLDDQVMTILSHFTSVSHFAIEIVSYQSLPSLGMMQWLYHHESYHLVIFLVPELCQAEVNHVFYRLHQDQGVKVILLDANHVPAHRTRWKYSLGPVDDSRGVWALGEAKKRNIETLVPRQAGYPLFASEVYSLMISLYKSTFFEIAF
ncbi:hypothetical protein DL96DRAFT_1682970 [Flagelloscypha sp. PMI_526]|nr:hypothetical protein DL96DRAFT_1682970 [Flagelloscypha sp. PMI_526]